MRQETGTVVSYAKTWLTKARWRLCDDAENPPQFWPEDLPLPETHYAGRLMLTTLDEIEHLVPLLEIEDYEYSDYARIEKAVRELASALKKRRLAEKLANTDGRTPEEAEMFAAKAKALGQ